MRPGWSNLKLKSTAIRNVEFNGMVEKTECGVRSTGCGVRSAECGVRSAEYGVRSAEYGVRSAESVSVKVFL